MGGSLATINPQKWWVRIISYKIKEFYGTEKAGVVET
jgi:hypothetical protein